MRNRLLPTLIFSALCFSSLSAEDISPRFNFEIRNYYDGKTYFTGVNSADLNKEPAWKAGDKNPPLSAKDASDVALKKLESVGKELKMSIGQIKIEAISLLNRGNDRWIYVVDLHLSEKERFPFQVLVLMDGMTPEIKEWTPIKRTSR